MSTTTTPVGSAPTESAESAGSVTTAAVAGSVTTAAVAGSVTTAAVAGSVTTAAVAGSVTTAAVAESVTTATPVSSVAPATTASAVAALPVVLPLPDDRVEVRGAAWLEPTDRGLLPHRLPAWTRAQFPDRFVALCDEQPAGVRLRLRTAATRLRLDVDVLRVAVDPQPPADPQPFDVVVDGELVEQPAGWGVASGGGVVELEPRHGTTVERPGATSSVDLALTAERAVDVASPAAVLARVAPPAEGVASLADRPADGAGVVRDVEVWLPYGEVVRLVALHADAPVLAPSRTAGRRWVHHGSSISHGAAADRPTGTWPVVAARTTGLDLVNLGMSGNAVLDPFVARTLRDATADVISVKLGINVVNHDAMRLRAFVPAVHGFLDTIREGHPTTPLVVVSPLLCPLVEDTPGPTFIDPASPAGAPVFATRGRPEDVADGRLTLRVIRRALADVVAARRAAGDDALHLVDGLDLYGADDAVALPMADLLHPDAPAQRLVGERFADVLRGLLGFATAPTCETDASPASDATGARGR
ncbi:SGNH/GDSL hydrolase family protein [Cellulomonas fimi]|uniref:SGNH/GDSL hydrolase family protein n=1 Tax=Cellulomonas fimi TaxID=1708 RepID=UPI0023598263|nr:SGNH/GDSL hydrolase family protein [Cellulomonas fimi]